MKVAPKYSGPILAAPQQTTTYLTADIYQLLGAFNKDR